MNNKKLIIALLALATSAVLITYLYLVSSKAVTSPQETVSQLENLPINDAVGSLLNDQNFDDARIYLEEERGSISEGQYNIQKNRIDAIESYSEFYESGDANARQQMLKQAIDTIDQHFLTIDSASSPDVDKERAIMAVAFLYSETWSDKSLLVHIAKKLNLDDSSLDTPAEQVAVFNELFTRAIDLLSTQDAYIKRAWFNSRLLITESFSENVTYRDEITNLILSDLEKSFARNGMRFTSRSSYYNSYTALAFADVMDFLYQEGKLDSYFEVDFAYKQALSVAAGDFFGKDIVADIIRMNYAASVYRAEGEFVDIEKVADIIRPVAQNIRLYSGKSDLSYEGILVMLRDIPIAQNQNNAAIFEIMSTYQEFADIPPLLNWSQTTKNSNYIFKLI